MNSYTPGGYARRWVSPPARSAQQTLATGGLYAEYLKAMDSPCLRRFIRNPDLFIDQLASHCYKDDKATTVVKLSFDGRWFVAKRYNSRHLGYRVKRLLRRSRARNCYEMSWRFYQAGLLAALPIAYVERRRGPFRGNSYYLCDYVDGLPLSDLVSDQTDCAELEQLAKKMADVFQTLDNNGLVHGDMKASNILLPNSQPVFVDMDASRRISAAWLHRNRLERDRRRFMKNWRDNAIAHKCFSRAMG